MSENKLISAVKTMLKAFFRQKSLWFLDFIKENKKQRDIIINFNRHISRWFNDNFLLDNYPPENYPQEISPRTITILTFAPWTICLPGQLPPWHLPPRLLPLRQLTLNISPWRTTPGQLPPIKSNPGQLLRRVSSWVVLSLNFTLVKRVLLLGILVEQVL